MECEDQYKDFLDFFTSALDLLLLVQSLKIFYSNCSYLHGSGKYSFGSEVNMYRLLSH